MYTRLELHKNKWGEAYDECEASEKTFKVNPSK